MAGLQRSAASFRRQGSSGLVWDNELLSSELNIELTDQKQEDTTTTIYNKSQQHHPQQLVQDQVKLSSSTTVGSIERSRSNGGARAFRTVKVSPAIEPPSPKVSACGFCSAFGKTHDKSRRRPKSGKRRT